MRALAFGIAASFAGSVCAGPRAGVLADVPFERAFGGVPFVSVRVNDSEPLQFMVDTGGAGSIIDQDVARRLGLKTVQGRASVSGNAALDVGVVPTATLRLGEATLTTRLTTHALAALEPTFGRPIHGILGGDFFQRFIVELNYDRNRILVHESYGGNPKGISLPLEISNGVPFITLGVRVNERTTLRGGFLIDTAGGWMTIHLHREVAERNKVTTPSAVAEKGLGLGGITNRTVLRGESLVVGPHRFEGPPVAITEDTAGLRTNPTSLGLVGIEVLRKFNIVFDYRGKHVYLAPSRAFSDRLIYDAAGLRLQTFSPGFTPARVSGVVPSSPAAEAGFQVGDTIVDVDGRPVAKSTVEELRESFRQPGRRYAVRVKRDGRIVRLLFATREML